MMVVGPSGSGKTVFLTALITDLYAGCFKRVYVFSPSVHSDPAWLPVKTFVQRELETDEPWAFDAYDPSALEAIIDTQKRVIAAAKAKKLKRMFSVLVVIDDFADNPSFSRHDKLLHSLFTRGRHAFISTVVSTQKLRAIATIVRVNTISLIVFRLRSAQELEAIVEEISAVYDKDTIVAMYRRATEEQYSFLYVDLAARTPGKMFMLRFHRYLVPAAAATAS